ncbi:MAG: hypothetical protein JSW28_06945 [Thermoplasmata archaeon]|nr:MAG: hypothetical protein JSW28_06945 [Thermoplasmata archaeon]
MVREDEIEEDFFKALIVTLGFLALFSLFIFIPLIGWFIAATFGAYFAGYRGARYSVNWRVLGLIAALIWATVLAVIAIIIISTLPLPVISDIYIGGWEIALICTLYILYILFCVLGARARFMEKAVYV